jgi:hypothetical protein
LFQTRADALKARAAVVGLESLLSGSQPGQSAVLEPALEELLAGAHEFRELKLLGSLRTGGVVLPPGQAEDAERLVGGRGNLPFQRLGLPPDADAEEIARETRRALDRWRQIAENPLLVEPSAVEACRVVLRSCEGILAAMPAAR